jgi:hypothetical protein
VEGRSSRCRSAEMHGSGIDTASLSLSLSAWAISMRREGLVYLVVVAAAALQAE